MSRRLTSLLLLATLTAAAGDENVRSVQEELRRRNIYFGDVDGRHTPETESALKSYQKRKGFTPTGQEDPETLRSLGLLARTPGEAPPKELVWPEETVLKSDEKVNVREEVTALASATGVAPESLVPIGEKLFSGWHGRPARRGTGSKTPAGAATPAAGGGMKPARGGGSTLGPIQAIDPREIFGFVQRYLRAVAKGDLAGELGFYADTVDYFGNGRVDRRIVEQTLRKYYTRWPHRSYRLAGINGYQASKGSAEITVTYRVNFSVKNDRGRAKGATDNTIIINAGTASPRIVSIRERRVRG